MLFDSQALGLEVNHRRVLDIYCYSNALGVVASAKGTGAYLPTHEPDLFDRMYRVAVKKASKTIVLRRRLDTSHPPRSAAALP